MDPVTHGLASYVFSRALWPRAGWSFRGCIIVAGTVADLDRLSVLAGPSAYLAAHRTFTHSLLGTVVLSAIVSGAFFFLRKKADRFSFAATFLMALSGALLHVALDSCQSEGLGLFWPFRDRRYAADWIAGIDVWTLAILLAGALLPGLFGLITEEIGARAKSPRGRLSAWLALAAVVGYLGGRMVLHAEAAGTLQAHTYRGETPRRAAAFPEAAAIFSWHGIVETERALHEVPVNIGPGAIFDPDAATTLYKLEPSAVLEAARGCSASQRFLRVVRFPKALVSKTEDGYRFELRDLRYGASGETPNAVAVLVELGPEARVRSQQIVWERDLGSH